MFAGIWTHATFARRSVTHWGKIRDLLAMVPEPLRIPAEVASRIDAALAAEALPPTGHRDTER